MLGEPPQAIEAERAVLAALLLDHEAVSIAAEELPVDALYRVPHQLMYRAILAVAERGDRPDPITVSEELGKRGDLEAVGGPVAISSILDYATTAANLSQHIRIIREKRVRRELQAAALDILRQDESSTLEDVIERAERSIYALADTRTRRRTTHVRELVKDAVEGMRLAKARGGRVTGVASGYPDLDELTGGFQHGDLVILAARPGMGKSAMMLCVAEHAALAGTPVSIFSLEMSGQQLAQRALCSLARLDLHRARRGLINALEMDKVVDASARLLNAPLVIDDTALLTIGELRSTCRRLQHEGQLGIVCVDYLQLMQSGDKLENRTSEVSAISRGLKSIARELRVPIIALAQLSRAVETRDKSGKPQLSDLRESGQIEADADVIMFLWREGYYNAATPEPNKTQLIIAKQRNGPVDSVPLTWLPQYTRFEPYARTAAPPPRLPYIDSEELFS